MVFNATFNNISIILWQSVLLVEETGVTDKLYHIMLSTSPWSGFELTTSVVIGTDCKGSCKSNYHTITATTAPKNEMNINYSYTLYTYLWCNTRSCSLVINLINWTLNYKHSSENITLKKFACVTWMGKVHSLGGVVFTWIWYIVKGIWNLI